jgi:hypothetical protein
MINIFKKQRASSVLGLALDGNRLEAVVLRRNNGSLQVKETLTATLALSPLSGDPELVGREIRNHLDQGGIRERLCAVCIPVSWVLTLQTKLPDLPEEDIASFLQLEAERGFTSGHENLFITSSRFRSPAGEQFATLMAIPRNHLATLEKALKAAQLKPATFALGVAALGSTGKEVPAGMLTLALGAYTIELEVASNGGVAALRSLDGAFEAEGSQRHIDADLVAREIRITLGQLPAALGESVKTVKILGRGELARQFTSDIGPRLQSMGLKAEVMDRASGAEFTAAVPSAVALSPALALAANWVRGVMSGPEFLPPKISPWQQFQSNKFASKKLGWAGAAAGGVALCVGGAFLFQQWQLMHWGSRWKAMEPQVKEVQEAQQQIRKYRPWFDKSFRGLRILRKVTEAFPESGIVTAKTVEIRDLTAVSCSGVARDKPSYLKIIDQLGAAEGITALNTESIRGQAPSMQFTFTFQWEGDTSGN